MTGFACHGALDEEFYRIVNDSDEMQDWIIEKCREDSRG
jgi:hypothetical protein